MRGERKSYVHFETENDSSVMFTFKRTKKTLIYNTRGGQHYNQTHLNESTIVHEEPNIANTSDLNCFTSDIQKCLE